MFFLGISFAGMADDFCASFIYFLPTSLVDLTQCRPVPIRQTLVFVNTFVIESIEFPNHFANIFVRYWLLFVVANLSWLNCSTGQVELCILQHFSSGNSSFYIGSKIKQRSWIRKHFGRCSRPCRCNACHNCRTWGSIGTSRFVNFLPWCFKNFGVVTAAASRTPIKDDPVYSRYLKLLNMGMPAGQVQTVRCYGFLPDINVQCLCLLSYHVCAVLYCILYSIVYCTVIIAINSF